MIPLTVKAEPSARILIVDDDADCRELMSLVLNHEGFVTMTAGTGHETLASAPTLALDLILLDIMLPDMSGYEVAAMLKDTSTTRQIPIILVSALNAYATKVQAAASGADGFVTKPVNRVDLVNRVRELLQLKSRDPVVGAGL